MNLNFAFQLVLLVVALPVIISADILIMALELLTPLRAPDSHILASSLAVCLTIFLPGLYLFWEGDIWTISQLTDSSETFGFKSDSDQVVLIQIDIRFCLSSCFVNFLKGWLAVSIAVGTGFSVLAAAFINFAKCSTLVIVWASSYPFTLMILCCIVGIKALLA